MADHDLRKRSLLDSEESDQQANHSQEDEASHLKRSRLNSPVPASSGASGGGGDYLSNLMQSVSHTRSQCGDALPTTLSLKDRIEKEKTARDRLVTDFTVFFETVAVHRLEPDPETLQPKLELELRLGRHTSSGFQPGVSKEDFDRLREMLGADPQYVCTESKKTDYFYFEEGQTYRISYDPKEMCCTEAISKENKERADYAQVPSWDIAYDMRFAASLETGFQVPVEPPPDQSEKRDKHRFQYTLRQDSYWIIDMTIVTMETPEGTVDTTYEVELELEEWVVDDESNPLENTPASLAVSLWDALRAICFPSAKDTSDLSLIEVEDMDEIRRLRRLICGFVPGLRSRDSPYFPGSMPVALSRHHFPTIQTNRYWVSEKTDGVRYFLLVTEDRAVYMVDRKFSLFYLAGFDGLGDLFGKGITLLDGELVTHAENQGKIFLVFDILAVNGVAYGAKFMEERLALIGSEVITPYRQAVEAGSITSKPPFLLLGKLFFPAKHLGSVVKRINAQRIYTGDSKRCYKADGVIFQPNGPYTPKGSQDFYKWKFPDMHTIDFVVRTDQRGILNLFCQANDDELIKCRTVRFSDDEEQTVRGHLALSGTEPLVCECLYDTKEGRWRFLHVRPDKKKANHISVVFDTFEAASENITQDEILYRVMVRPDTDQYFRQISKMHASLLEVVYRNHAAQHHH